MYFVTVLSKYVTIINISEYKVFKFCNLIIIKNSTENSIVSILLFFYY